ncbi:MerR family transcriptional regulator [Stutzerimonas stutzeri]|jgi:DNA-binding transcriptional MerR regulator|uniref:MerR family transcriptional regulator n=1 Tax=Stutzerimonas TaxID=2901164 RepID=UPI00066D0712|nr:MULTISPECIES: MerR family transcriptional regulator [Stutzerimonas]MDL2174745.1 MerR family transcriptional regulator [Stutzerimonas sp. FeSN7]RRW09756.1 MerR family transcriptional regulator [Stutzerimonas stutzeri]HAG18825.1 MerR family transcriptional regulator [Pseudomonas sp.]
MTEPSGASTLASNAFEQQELFPIREVSRLTGVNPVTLRAWERRYGLIRPTRTDSGHRLYSMADVEAVRSILAWTERGVAVSKVGSILARSAATREAEKPTVTATGEWSEWQAQLRDAVRSFDEVRLEQLYGQVFSTYPLAVVFQDVLLPVWQALLLRQDEFGGSSEWLFLDAFLRARALQRLQLARVPGAERVLLSALPGQCRELELLVAGLLLSGDSLAVTVLPLGQPLEELALVCDKMRPQGLVMFSNVPPNEVQLRQLNKLSLSLDCPLALAGEAAELGREALAGSPIACLGSSGKLMQRRLRQFLAGQLDT